MLPLSALQGVQLARWILYSNVLKSILPCRPQCCHIFYNEQLSRVSWHKPPGCWGTGRSSLLEILGPGILNSIRVNCVLQLTYYWTVFVWIVSCSSLPMPLSPSWPSDHCCVSSQLSRTHVKTFQNFKIEFEILNSAYAMEGGGSPQLYYHDGHWWSWFGSLQIQSLSNTWRERIR